MIRTRNAVLVASAAAGLISLSACGGGGYGSGAYDSGSAPANQSQGVNPEASPAGGVTLAAAEVGELGQVVTDQNGLTLYRFEKDKAKPSVSNCNDACAKTWPPALGDPASVQLQGVDQTLVGSVTRADGTEQLTLSGWPLYTYAKDTAAGDAKGQGVGKTWFAVTPKGKKAKATASGAPDRAPANVPGSVPDKAPDSGYGSGYGSSGGY
jgi:predicted lipoprotein with Yx(FWY)xxD motif